MEDIMRSVTGILFILANLVAAALLWYFAAPNEPLNTMEQLGYVVGGLALTSFYLVFLLSVRNKTIEKWFNGLENVYLNHKILAVIAVALTFVHSQLLEIGEHEERGEYSERYEERDEYEEYENNSFPTSEEFKVEREEKDDLEHFAKEMGEVARNGFLALVIIAFFAKFLKYEHWRYIHRLMIVPYAIGLFHTYFTDKYNLFQLTPIGIFMAITSIIGVGAGLYMMIAYQSTQFKHKGKITGIKKLGHAVELELTLDKVLQFQDGQYVFLKVFQQGLEKAPHPFTISGRDGNKIYMTIKALGDFTKKLNDTIQLNTEVAIEGPYGHMNFDKGRQRQVWVAGGVGITPFISYLKNKPTTKDIELFYSYRGADDAIYKEFLQQYALDNPNFKVHFKDTSVEGRLNFDNFALANDTSIFMCGPVKMIKNFNKQLKAKNTNADMTFEAFKFR